MKVVCMGTNIGDDGVRECGKLLSGDPSDTQVSHGVCADCKAAYREDSALAKLATAAMDAEDEAHREYPGDPAAAIDSLERFADERRRRDMPEMTEVEQERIFRDTCIECAEPLRWEMDSDCRYVACCNFNYSTPLLRGDLVTVTDGEGQIYE